MTGVMQAVKTRMPNTVKELVTRTDSPFTQAVMEVPLQPKFKMQTMDMFDGTKDPLDHLETYKALVQLQAVPDVVICRAFPITLKGTARVWFNRLQPSTVSSFMQFSKLFVGHYIGA